MRGAVAIEFQRSHVTIIPVFLMLHAGVLHRLAPLLDLGTGIFKARGALAQVLVLQLQARRQQIDHQRIGHLLAGRHCQMHQHQITTFQRIEIKRLAIHTQVIAANAHVLAARHRRLLWITRNRQLLINRFASLIAQGQRRVQQCPVQLEPGLAVVQLAGLATAGKRGRPAGFRFAQQITPRQEQRITLLSRQPLTGRQLIRQLKQPLLTLAVEQIVFFQQRQNQRLITQRAAVIAQPLIGFTGDGQACRQGLIGPRLITHLLQGNRQLHQWQPGTGITAPFKNTA